MNEKLKKFNEPKNLVLIFFHKKPSAFQSEKQLVLWSKS